MVTEIAQNTGPSVTNSAEAVHRLLVDRFGPGVIHVEHYGPESYEGGGREDTWDRVTVDARGHAQWEHLTEEAFDRLTGRNAGLKPWPRRGVYRADVEFAAWFVPSLSLPGTYRLVEYHSDGRHIYFSCSCPAGQQRERMGTHHERPCRHVLAVSAAEADDGYERRPTPPAAVSALVD